ncbi:hypothetical protein [Thalassobacillus sp. B23F22_16]|uniref:hypothetical protein n=1 Tax=Thalassobacillus sp. B23F22_16 TaxID=3459513 RepID=UPI00373F0137
MRKSKVIFIGLFILLIVSACSQSTEKEIIGTWENTDEEDDCDTNMDEKITFSDDGMVVGIEGFKDYKIEETDNDDYDYAILSGGYEDTARYRVNITDEGHLQIVYEEDDLYDFDDGIACHMEKVNE